MAGSVETPDIVGVVNQQFFIEPQGGPKHPVNYLEEFPSTLYNTSLNSNLVAIMYAILGPAGLGSLKKEYLESRLSVEDNGLRTVDLDAFYGEPFSFARLATESYEDDTTGLLSNLQWEQIQESDSSYKNRAINYLSALRAGGTLLGITLAAKSGLARAVEVVENYRALYDLHSDNPLELEKLGITDSTEEVILLPRQEHPVSAQQTISIKGNPVDGFFKLCLPLGANTEVGQVFGKGAQNTSVTGTLPYNVDAKANEGTNVSVQQALEELSVVGNHNVEVTGGPFPNNPIVITFQNELSDREIPQILVYETDLFDEEGKECVIDVEVDTVGISADGQDATIPPEDWHYALEAIGNIKPVTCIITPGKSKGITKRQPVGANFADSELIEVLRYVTGRRGVPWPEISTVNWIEAGVEHEGPVPLNAELAHYVNFHNISTAKAYEQANVEEVGYEAGIFVANNEHHGQYSTEQATLYPLLEIGGVVGRTFAATDALITPPELITAENSVEGTPLIAGIYPIDYAKFAEVRSAPTETTPFWSSNEAKEGIDYLEVDLGTVQAVNMITFEATTKPYEVSIAYDVLDHAPERRFVPVTYDDMRIATSTLALGYEAGSPNQWRESTMYVGNILNQIIFTRFIRLAFKRRTGSLFTLKNGVQLPYSIEVRNLRIGRNVAP